MTAAAGAELSGPDARRGVVPPADRGRLVIADKVITKIAVQAAREASAATGHGGAASARGGAMPAAPRVRVSLTDNVARLTVELGVTFPRPMRATVTEIQRHLSRRLKQLAGVDVARVDVRIVRLSVEAPGSTDEQGALA